MRRRWLIWGGTALAFAAVVVLGTIGFTRYEEAIGRVDPLGTRLYLALQLFALESGSISGPVPLELEIARIAAPLLTGSAVAGVLVVLFREQAGRLRLMTFRDHLVVIGLGRKGLALARQARLGGQRVVAIEIDPGNLGLEPIRALGGVVIVGDARSPGTLERARLRHAGQLAVLCGPDRTNIEIANRSRDLTQGRRSGDLRCVVHIANPDLARLLQASELERYGEAPIRVEFFSLHQMAAQALLGLHPPVALAGEPASTVAVVGSGWTAEAVLLALVRGWATAPAVAGQARVVLVGASSGVASELRSRHAEVGLVGELSVVPDVDQLPGGAIPDVAYVCPDDDETALAAALTLRSLLARHPARIVVVLEAREGLADLLERAARSDGGPEVHAFGLIEDTCRPDVLIGGTTDVLARALHEAYIASTGGPDPSDPARRPWSELGAQLRESNRDHAAHVAVKLGAVSRTLGPLRDWAVANRPFSDAEVEVMARLEHDRWVAERRRSGWTAGPRDPVRRTTPYLVDWAELAEDVRERDRLFIRELPGLLASVGLQAFRPEDLWPTPPGAASERLPVEV